ncbi:hypothetical protein [Cupriavidus sp. D384]|uniref:hypothetical protein n=1 Tax=Cupriavidus sp. D384 TaxID=1538095 RepID=UPI000A3F3B7D|nr:hypothetical protein [Cupriavidus sp. D384]
MRVIAIALVCASSLFGGCASIVSGTNQVVSVETRDHDQPHAGAKCKLTNSKGTYYVTTPGTITINRAYGDMSVRCDKDGQEPGLATVKSTTKAAAFGNILIGGAIGVAVDTASGAAYDYPDLIMVRMGMNSIVSIPATANGLGHVETSLPAATGYADAANIDAVPYLRARKGYATYRDRKAPKAFVLADGGHYAFWGNSPNAIEKAMARCREMRFTNCRLYAYDDVVVWERSFALTPEDPPEGESRSRVLSRSDTQQ